jgi:hypothetical protein
MVSPEMVIQSVSTLPSIVKQGILPVFFLMLVFVILLCGDDLKML